RWVTLPRASGSPHSPSVVPAASIAAQPWRRSWPGGCAAPDYRPPSYTAIWVASEHPRSDAPRHVWLVGSNASCCGGLRWWAWTGRVVDGVAPGDRPLDRDRDGR